MPDTTDIANLAPETTYPLLLHTGAAGAVPADNASPRKIYQGDGTELPIAITVGMLWVGGKRVAVFETPTEFESATLKADVFRATDEGVGKSWLSSLQLGLIGQDSECGVVQTAVDELAEWQNVTWMAVSGYAVVARVGIFANDGAAAFAGVEVGEIYFTGTKFRVRMV